MAAEPALDQELKDGRTIFRASGPWLSSTAEKLEALVDAAPPTRGTVELDLTRIEQLDTLGARLIERLRTQQAAAATQVSIRTKDEDQRDLFDEISHKSALAPVPRPRTSVFVDWLAEIGEAMREAGRDVVAINAFLGECLVTLAWMIFGKGKFRFPAIVTQMERMILRGVPIIVLISFVVGAIVSQQTIFQLQQFGAVIFVVDLLGILMLREVGLLLAAIMVAGRSGSAVTAEIGSMKMREEVDALRVMGLNPIEVLVLPRLIALVVGMPLLSFIASMSGLVGGGLVAWVYGDIPPATFIERLQAAIWMNTFLVGLIKAPFMGLIVGLIACNEGFRVQGSAESLGRQTTISVVKSIFMVILVDGLFAMFFASIRY